MEKGEVEARNDNSFCLGHCVDGGAITETGVLDLLSLWCQRDIQMEMSSMQLDIGV